MKDRLLDYLRTNLTDAGTMRSVVWALLGLGMNARAEGAIEHYATLGVFVLGMVSALIPPRRP